LGALDLIVKSEQHGEALKQKRFSQQEEVAQTTGLEDAMEERRHAAQGDSTETARHTRFRREVAHTTEVECAAQTLGRDATHSSYYFTRDSHREARDLRDTRDARHALDRARDGRRQRNPRLDGAYAATRATHAISRATRRALGTTRARAGSNDGDFSDS
jgi:hypothetical protein